MKVKSPIATFIGFALIFIALLGIVVLHEYAISDIMLLAGVPILFWFGIDVKINTKQASDNIQTYNDILWGKEQKKEEVPKESGAIRISGQTYEVDQILLKKK